MKFWELTIDQRKNIFTQVSIEHNIPVQAIEKDWWVCLILRAIFTSKEAKWFTFKGGTSLSKGWGLIQRFSEDIDLAVDRSKWGYNEGISKNKINALRKQSREYIKDELVPLINKTLIDWGINEGVEFEVVEKYNKDGTAISDRDPTEVTIRYNSLFEAHQYLKAQVKLEVSARSMHEPVENRSINSFVDTQYSEHLFVEPPFDVLSVMPTRTFLEKAILLHEGFCAEFTPEKAERKSRHLHDLVQLMDTEYGIQAAGDKDLFVKIVEHRKKFTKEKGVDYEVLTRETISFVPPGAIVSFWEADYKTMTESMIQGEVVPFEVLMKKLAELQERFRKN
jgi:hypothetical protein